MVMIICLNNHIGPKNT